MDSQQASQLEEFVTGKMSDESLYFLESAGKWAKFLAILGFIGVGLLACAGLWLLTIAPAIKTPTEDARPDAPLISFMGFPFLIIAGIILVPCFYLYRFSTHAQLAIRDGDSEAITESLRYLRAHFRFIGILMLLLIGGLLLGAMASIVVMISISL
jgi:hypothetical protein